MAESESLRMTRLTDEWCEKVAEGWREADREREARERAERELRLQEADPEATQYDGPFWKGQWLFALRHNERALSREREWRNQAIDEGTRALVETQKERDREREAHKQVERELREVEDELVRWEDRYDQALGRAEGAEAEVERLREVVSRPDDQLRADYERNRIDLADAVEALRSYVKHHGDEYGNAQARALLDRLDKPKDQPEELRQVRGH